MKSKLFFQIFEFFAGDLLEMESVFPFCREVIPVRNAGIFRKNAEIPTDCRRSAVFRRRCGIFSFRDCLPHGSGYSIRKTKRESFMKKILQYDVARGRIPRPETVFKQLDLLRPYGLDGIQFYLENVVENSVFPSAGAGENPITAEYLAQIRSYTDAHGLEFIPHFEILSHLEHLLALPEMEPYRDTPEGGHCCRIDLPEFREKMKAYLKEVSAYFSSPYVHCGGDEAFNLGLGRSRAYLEKHGFEEAFAEYVNDIAAFLRSIGKTMLFYADEPIVYPKLRQLLSPEIVLVNWAYCGRHEVYEVENYHYSRHAQSVAGHRFWVTGNCMAEYVFTPFERLSENVAIWRELGKGAETFVISDWGSDENTNPYVLTTLGTIYALKAFEDASYSQEDFIRDVESLILSRPDDDFRNAYRILLDASGTKYWSPELIYRGPLLPARLFADPDSRGLCLGAGMTDPVKLDELIRDVRSAVAWFESADPASMAQPELFADLRDLSKRVLATVLRAKLCYLHAHNTGGVWFTQKELEPQILLYEECMDLMRKDLKFMKENWRKESLPTCYDRAEAYYLRALETTKKALHLPETSLRIFPPR